MENNELVRNRRAYHDYEILETYEAGIVLLGTEIKSLRAHGGNIAEAYVKVIGKEVWLIGSSIAPYKFGSAFNHEERRDRKLLLHKREIEKLRAGVQQKGMALIPIALYLKKGKVKVSIGYSKGKKKADKRQSILEKEKKREMERAIKRHS